MNENESERFFMLALSEASDAHREAVHAIVRAHSGRWWHAFPDLWIAQGHNHVYWADLVKPVLALSPAALVVLELPRNASARHFSIRGGSAPELKARWLFSEYWNDFDTGPTYPQLPMPDD